MKHLSIILALPIACMMACSSNDDTDEIIAPPTTQRKPILIEVSEKPLIDPEAGNDNKAAARKAPIFTKETLSNFYINGYWNESGILDPDRAYLTTTDNKSVWVTNNPWPQVDENTEIKFYAYSNVDYTNPPFEYGSYNGGYNPSLYFEVDEYAEDQKDLLVAKQIAKPKDETVHFYFTHPCAALQFAICKTKALTNFQITVKNIILHNIYNSGSYYFETDSWDVYTDKKSLFTLAAYNGNSNSITVDTEVSSSDRTNSKLLGRDENDFMFFIPQEIQAWNGGSVDETDGAYIEIKCSIIKNSNSKEYADNGSVYIPFSATLEKGYIHRFNIRMGSSLKDCNGNPIDFANNN